jgi:hypothetical protein
LWTATDSFYARCHSLVELTWRRDSDGLMLVRQSSHVQAETFALSLTTPCVFHPPNRPANKHSISPQCPSDYG